MMENVVLRSNDEIVSVIDVALVLTDAKQCSFIDDILGILILKIGATRMKQESSCITLKQFFT